MGRFRYRMQNILDVKIKMETQAKNEFAAANLALEEEKEKMNALIGRRGFYEKKTKEALNADPMDFMGITESKIAIRSLEEQMRKQLQVIKRAEKFLEEKRQAMTSAMQERKTHETLREQAFEEFLQEEKREESKQIDELTSYTYGLKQNES